MVGSGSHHHDTASMARKNEFQNLSLSGTENRNGHRQTFLLGRSGSFKCRLIVKFCLNHKFVTMPCFFDSIQRELLYIISCEDFDHWLFGP